MAERERVRGREHRNSRSENFLTFDYFSWISFRVGKTFWLSHGILFQNIQIVLNLINYVQPSEKYYVEEVRWRSVWKIVCVCVRSLSKIVDANTTHSSAYKGICIYIYVESQQWQQQLYQHCVEQQGALRYIIFHRNFPPNKRARGRHTILMKRIKSIRTWKHEEITKGRKDVCSYAVIVCRNRCTKTFLENYSWFSHNLKCQT